MMRWPKKGARERFAQKTLVSLLGILSSVPIENEINVNRLDVICSVTRDREEPGI